MYIVAWISILLVSHCVLAKCIEPVTKAFTIIKSLPSRLYLPSSGNPEPKNRARSSDIDTVPENDLQVIPLAVDHYQRNGFQYQPIISRQYSPGFTESPRYSQSAVPNVLQTVNTTGLGSPISNVNEVKPITKSQQLSCVAVAYSSTPKENNPGEEIRGSGGSSCLRKFQSHGSPVDQTPANLPRRKILTVNDQENKTQQGRLSLQLTPPREEDISGISRRPTIDKVSGPGSSLTKSASVTAYGLRSKDMILIGQPTTYSDQDIKPVFESNEYQNNYKYYNNCDDYNERDYQLGTRNAAAPKAGSFNGPLQRPQPMNIPTQLTCSGNILERFLLQTYQEQGYNYGYNTREHLPTNPVLALLLSHYGRYLPGVRVPRVYGYMAVNNIHNNKPFGSYKLTRDDDVADNF